MIATAFSALKKDKEFTNLDPLPPWLREENNLIGKMEALEKIHQPDQEQVEEYLQFRSPAQRRLIFDDFFFLQLYMGLKRAGLKKEQTYPIKACSTFSEKLKKSLNFS